jgi:hypothetical protein
MRQVAAALIAFLAVASAAVPAPNEPYAVAASVTAQEHHNYTVHVTIKDQRTGEVVFAPTVTTQPNVPAEIVSDPAPNAPQFEVRVEVAANGSASVTFRAFEHILQRSRVHAKPQAH